MVTKRRRHILCVHTLWGCGSEKLFIGSLFQVELASSKARRALGAGSSLVRYARQVFLRVFLFSRLSPTFRRLSSPQDTPSRCFTTKGSPRPRRQKRPTTFPTLPRRSTSTRNDSSRTYARSCLPVIYLFSIRHSPHRHSHSSPSSLEQTGGPSESYSCVSLRLGVGR
jgi:hypothetical protein